MNIILSQHHTYEQQQIFRLQIAMSHLVRMTISQSFEENLANITSFLLVIVRLLDDSIEQFTSTHFLSHEVVVLTFIKDIIQPDDVLVLKLFQNRNLVLQCVLIFLGQFSLGDNLDGKGIARLFMHPIFNDRKGPFTELHSQQNRKGKCS
jgi:hypothetical protein